MFLQLLTLVVILQGIVARSDFWSQNPECNKIRGSKRQASRVPREKQVFCIVRCIAETGNPNMDIKPKNCIKYLLEPYFKERLKRLLPDKTDFDSCFSKKDRSECKDTLLYYFVNWYKDNYDDPKAYAAFLFHAWVHHPDVEHPIKSYEFPDWDMWKLNELSNLKYNTDDDIKDTVKFTEWTCPSSKIKFYSEFARYCSGQIKANAVHFCKFKELSEIACTLSRLAKGKSKFGRRFEKYAQAIRLIFATISVTHDTMDAKKIYDLPINDKLKLYDHVLDYIFSLSKRNDMEKLKELFSFMPGLNALEKACKQTRYPNVSEKSCVLERVQEQIQSYLNMIAQRTSQSPNRRVLIDNSLNLRTIITESRGEEIMNLLSRLSYDIVKNQEEVVQIIEGRFAQMQSYFQRLQDFNMQKAVADVDYIKGVVSSYNKSVKDVIADVKKYVGGLLKAALTAQGLELAYDLAKLLVTAIEAANPMKAVFNGGTATDLMDAMSKVQKSLANLGKARNLLEGWPKVIASLQIIADKLDKNSDFLSAVGHIIDKVRGDNFPKGDVFESNKETFLRLYAEYTPELKKTDLESLKTHMDYVVEKSCESLTNTDSTAAALYEMNTIKDQPCLKSTLSVTKLITTYEEIYDFQFQLIDAMAEYLRAATGYHATTEIRHLSSDLLDTELLRDRKRNNMKANVILAHITYEIQKLTALQELCDLLEYEEGGEMPAVCKNPQLSAPTLLAYKTHPCRSINRFVSIPTTITSLEPSDGINLPQLYAGKEVVFRIPNFQWLKQHGWLHDDDEYDAILVKNFQIFLPTKSQNSHQIKIKAMEGNRLTPNGIVYSLIPSTTFVVAYENEEKCSSCVGTKIENPYNNCKHRKLPKLCITTEDPNFDDTSKLYPSIFTSWRIKSRKLEQIQIPDPASPLLLKAKVNLCVFDNKFRRKKRSTKDRGGCCLGNKYWDHAQRMCKRCPNGSRSNLNGYYCEKNPKALWSQ